MDKRNQEQFMDTFLCQDSPVLVDDDRHKATSFLALVRTEGARRRASVTGMSPGKSIRSLQRPPRVVKYLLSDAIGIEPERFSLLFDIILFIVLPL